MTKEQIIEVFSRKAKEIIIAEYKVDDRYIFTNQGKEAIADELLALFKQEKKEAAKEIFENILVSEARVFEDDDNECIAWTKQQIKNIAKEYGVEL